MITTVGALLDVIEEWQTKNKMIREQLWTVPLSVVTKRLDIDDDEARYDIIGGDVLEIDKVYYVPMTGGLAIQGSPQD